MKIEDMTLALGEVVIWPGYRDIPPQQAHKAWVEQKARLLPGYQDGSRFAADN